MGKNKYYVVWKGKKPGIYNSWESCKEHVEGVEGAKYKGFPTYELAECAFDDDLQKYLSGGFRELKKITCTDPLIGMPLPDSICVDAACKGNPGILEYRGVDTKSGAELFRQGPFPHKTVNIDEFLAVVHALTYLKQKDSDWPIYSDSRTAITWVRKQAVKTNLERTADSEQLFSLVDRAINWLKRNTYPNRVIKWETGFWGEIPADYGRK